MNDTQDTTIRTLGATTQPRSQSAEHSRNVPETGILPGDDLEQFLARHHELCHFCQQTFDDIYRNYTDLNDILALTDAGGRLICFHSSPEVLALATREMGLRYGILLTESSCGSNAITLALRYREAMISSRPAHQRTPFANRATIAVPLLDAEQHAVGCVAIFNAGEGSLGEKLLLAKFIAREISHQYLDATSRIAIASLPTHGALDGVTPCPLEEVSPLPSLMERRAGDRRGMQRAAVPCVKLTRRQLQVLQLFAQGKGYKEIARDIGITSYKTVEEHLDAVREKLQVAHRRECIQKAMSLGLL